MIYNSVVYLTYEVNYTKFEVDGDNSFVENFRKPIEQSDCSICLKSLDYDNMR